MRETDRNSVQQAIAVREKSYILSRRGLHRVGAQRPGKRVSNSSGGPLLVLEALIAGHLFIMLYDPHLFFGQAMRNLLVKPILIVLTGRTFPSISQSNGDFDSWIASGLGEDVEYRCLDARLARELPSPLDFAGVIVSGSHAMVTDRADWSEQLAQWLKICIEAAVPVLGICYGHQLLAHALGGRVDNHPAGIEIGTRSVELVESAYRDPLLKGLPKKFPAHLVHFQSVLGLPDGAISLARSEHDPHQAFRFGPCAWGLQFHPEFSTSAMKGYLVETAVAGSKPTTKTRALHAVVDPTPEAAGLLKSFAAFAQAYSCRETTTNPPSNKFRPTVPDVPSV